MWLNADSTRKWRSDSLEARIYAAAEAMALANESDDPDGEAMEAVFRVMGWLYSNKYSVVVDLIDEAYGVPTSQTALSNFWERFCSPWLSERMRRSSAAARELANTLDTAGVQRATAELVSQQMFELVSSPNPDPERVAQFTKLLLASQKEQREQARLELDREKFALMEKKAEFADEVKKAAENREGGLTSEDLEEIERKLKLI